MSTVFENHRKSLICEQKGQTVLPDRSILIGQIFVENAKIEKNPMRHFYTKYKKNYIKFARKVTDRTAISRSKELNKT